MILSTIPLVYPWDVNGVKLANSNKPKNIHGSVVMKEYVCP